jgi:hypothetical protein
MFGGLVSMKGVTRGKASRERIRAWIEEGGIDQAFNKGNSTAIAIAKKEKKMLG